MENICVKFDIGLYSSGSYKKLRYNNLVDWNKNILCDRFYLPLTPQKYNKLFVINDTKDIEHVERTINLFSDKFEKEDMFYSGIDWGGRQKYEELESRITPILDKPLTYFGPIMDGKFSYSLIKHYKIKIIDQKSILFKDINKLAHKKVSLNDFSKEIIEFNDGKFFIDDFLTVCKETIKAANEKCEFFLDRYFSTIIFNNFDLNFNQNLFALFNYVCVYEILSQIDLSKKDELKFVDFCGNAIKNMKRTYDAIIEQSKVNVANTYNLISIDSKCDYLIGSYIKDTINNMFTKQRIITDQNYSHVIDTAKTLIKTESDKDIINFMEFTFKKLFSLRETIRKINNNFGYIAFQKNN